MRDARLQTMGTSEQRAGGVRPALITTIKPDACRKEISDALRERAYEIYRRRGKRAGNAHEDWQLAEKDLLEPLCCGILSSKDGIVISLHQSDLPVSEIEVCAEPRRLVVIQKTHSGDDPEEIKRTFRVLPLGVEVDPASVAVRPHGRFLDIEVRKAAARPQTNCSEAATA